MTPCSQNREVKEVIGGKRHLGIKKVTTKVHLVVMQFDELLASYYFFWSYYDLFCILCHFVERPLTKHEV